MEITLTPELESLVNEEILSGNYDSPNEVLRDSLLLLKEQKLSRQVRRENLRREVQKGIDQMRNGQFKTYSSADEMMEEIIKEARVEVESRKVNGK
ncbi:MAG: type II toxin-antitoxin system ParD family antitoxin [Acidobacteriota bacterium]|nr:type II toxin-antitoxin system ParD family antitoxin [Acidobacteriota bacterium]